MEREEEEEDMDRGGRRDDRRFRWETTVALVETTVALGEKRPSL